MSVAEAIRLPAPDELRAARAVGPLGRLGRWTAGHVGIVALAWVVLALGLGAVAPRVESALSGAGWEASGSESVAARKLVQERFAGLSSQAFMVVVHSETKTTADPAFRATVAAVSATLRGSNDVTSVVPPQPGQTISADGHTAIVTAGAAGTPTDAVAAADSLKGRAGRARHRRRLGLPHWGLRDVVGLQRRQQGRRCSSRSSSPGR